ncbi:DUF7059 domain-containing protein [Agromyces subbeticus]|uniref:DUF7059 domain-containing protein n=1 Tax=Agromyces subbeticus TaxID=293890 RepID=UPI0003B57A0B|nr:methyltransferase [Agromyces subbeticus]
MSTEPASTPERVVSAVDDARAAELLERLRTDLGAASYTVAAVDALWGPAPAAALHRGERVPARRALAAQRVAPGGLPARAVLAALFVLGDDVEVSELEQALPALGVAGAIELGLVTVDRGGASARAALDLRPYGFTDARGGGEWWIISDVGELMLDGALGEQHVLGVGGASMTLSGLMLPTPTATVLDLGTGCGIQAMHASRFAERVVATDISERALMIASLNLALNGIEGVELRLGSLFEPVAGERFDRIVSNPPFVITPRAEGVPEYDYRDGGMVGDALVEAVVGGMHEHLQPGEIAQLLGNWEYRAEEQLDALERVGGWAGALDHWVVEREVQHVTEYAETWIRDGGTKPGTAEFDRLYDVWLDDFAARGVESVGFGYVLLRRADAAASAPRRFARLERLHGPLGSNAEGLGAHLAECLAARDRQAQLDDAALAAARFVTAGDVTEERHYWPGDDDPTAMLLRQGGGFCRVITLDTGLAALVGACDGELAIGAIVGALAELLDVDEAALARELLPAVRTLVDDGLLRFAE